MPDSVTSGPTAHAAELRLGRIACAGTAEGGVIWRMGCRHALAPGALLAVFATLGAVSTGIAASFWLNGAPLVLPFAVLELLALGTALVVHAWHAADAERIELGGSHLTVEQRWGARTQRVDFEPAWVRVGPTCGDGSLVELHGQGRRVRVGRYLRPELRAQLGRELRWALCRRPAQAGIDTA